MPHSALGSLSPDTLHDMAEAALEVLEWQRVLARTGDSVLGEVTAHLDPLREWEHYPPGDVYDADSHAQYYFHVHPVAERPPGEVGHFHTFLRGSGMPPGLTPVVAAGTDPVSHLIGIGIDRHGHATRLFTTNRWVTDESWYAAPDVAAMLDRFAIDHARPSWPVNRWVAAVMRLFRLEIVTLLVERDQAVMDWASLRPLAGVLEDRALEVTSEAQISVDQHLASITRALGP